MRKRLYIAATSQHVGKTTTTLGLVAAVRQQGIKVGYCKPVGQEFVDLDNLQVDKDALLFSKFMDFKLRSLVHSPVILGRGATTSYLECPSDYNYKNDILNAAEVLENEYEMVIYEGTGHPGVGSVVDLSNADVAKMLDASVVMVVEGGIGNTIDRLHMSTAVFRERGIPVIGVIINKVLPEKMELIQRLVGGKLAAMGMPLIGMLPYDKSLSYPIMETIREATRGKVLYNIENLDNRVEDVIAASLLHTEDLSERENILLVTSQKRLNESIERIKTMMADNPGHNPLSGLVLTGDGTHESTLSTDIMAERFIKEHQLPVIATRLDTYGAAVKISKIEVKINIRTPWKVQRAIELITENVNVEPLIND